MPDPFVNEMERGNRCCEENRILLAQIGTKVPISLRPSESVGIYRASRREYLRHYASKLIAVAN